MATISEDYVSFEIAKLLKEKEFDVYGDGSFDSGIEVFAEYSPSGTLNKCTDSKPHQKAYPAPTLQMAMKWLREVHNIYYEIQLLLGDKAVKYGDLQLGVYKLSSSGAYSWKCWLYANTYEELYEKYIKYCLENLI